MTGQERFSEFLLANEDAQAELGVRERTSVWVGSPFEWLMRLPSRSRGKAGEVLAANWLRRLGLPVQRAVHAGHDRVVAGVPVEIKMSTLWEQGDYVFQQLRDQDYEQVLLLGISPAAAHAWFLPKREAWSRSVPQHGGRTGIDTRWLRFRASDPPTWLAPFGGELERCVAAVMSVVAAGGV